MPARCRPRRLRRLATGYRAGHSVHTRRPRAASAGPQPGRRPIATFGAARPRAGQAAGTHARRPPAAHATRTRTPGSSAAGPAHHGRPRPSHSSVGWLASAHAAPRPWMPARADTRHRPRAVQATRQRQARLSGAYATSAVSPHASNVEFGRAAGVELGSPGQSGASCSPPRDATPAAIASAGLGRGRQKSLKRAPGHRAFFHLRRRHLHRDQAAPALARPIPRSPSAANLRSRPCPLARQGPSASAKSPRFGEGPGVERHQADGRAHLSVQEARAPLVRAICLARRRSTTTALRVQPEPRSRPALCDNSRIPSGPTVRRPSPRDPNHIDIARVVNAQDFIKSVPARAAARPLPDPRKIDFAVSIGISAAETLDPGPGLLPCPRAVHQEVLAAGSSPRLGEYGTGSVRVPGHE